MKELPGMRVEVEPGAVVVGDPPVGLVTGGVVGGTVVGAVVGELTVVVPCKHCQKYGLSSVHTHPAVHTVGPVHP